MTERVVITGLGIVAPNANGLQAYSKALKDGVSGIRYYEELKELNFACQVGGKPQGTEAIANNYFTQEQLLAMNEGMTYGAIAAVDCWQDAGFARPDADDDAVNWDAGAIIGTGIGGMDTAGNKLMPLVNNGRVRRLGSTLVEQVMASSPSALIGGLFALGGQVTTNSSACTTGTEAIVMAYDLIASAKLKRVLAGGTEGSSPYIWAGFDSMRVLARGYNDSPQKASRPMSASAGGFVPGSGAGILMLESLSSAQQRGARIYAEVLAGQVNCGGQRGGGSISAPNPHGVQRCIRQTLEQAQLKAVDIDLINGHLTATMADPMEVLNWQQALGCHPEELPLINSTKSMIGHGLGAAGGLEAVASVLQLHEGFVHGSLNCEDLHPKLEPFSNSIVHKTRKTDASILAKASFGFGDVNGCYIIKRWQ